MHAEGVLTVLWEVQKIKKGRSRKGGAQLGPGANGFGPNRVGSGEEYKKGCDPTFLIFPFSFSFFSFLRAKRSLLSPPSPLSFPTRGSGRRRRRRGGRPS